MGLSWELSQDPYGPSPVALAGLGVSRSLPAEQMGPAFVPGERLRVLMVISRAHGAGDVGYWVIARRLLHDTPGPVFLVVDGHPVHHSTAVHQFAASTDGQLRLFFLPGYSPELNLDEWVWKMSKPTGSAAPAPPAPTT